MATWAEAYVIITETTSITVYITGGVWVLKLDRTQDRGVGGSNKRDTAVHDWSLIVIIKDRPPNCPSSL